MNVNLRLTSTFWAAADKLPSGQKSKVIKFIRQYPENPQSSGFNFEKIKLGSTDKMRSLRLDQKYRIIAHQEKANNTIICLHVDVHDAAYQWARSHRFEKNAHTGIYQTIVITESSEVKTDPTHPKLFHEYRDRQLLSLGVPKEQLVLVRSFETIDDLNDHVHLLPDDVWVVLSDLASGVSFDDIAREITRQAQQFHGQNEFEHPDNQCQFVTITDKDLQKMVNAPLSEWRIYLHPSQERIVRMRANGPIRVLGGAGTGKTVAAMHRAKYLASEIFTKSSERILFLVFNSNLAADITANLKKMCAPDIFARIHIDNVDSWVVEQAKKHGIPYQMTYFASKQILAQQAWKIAIDSADNLPYSEHFIRDEFEAVVASEGIQSMQSYLRASRRGRGRRLSRQSRRQLWQVFESYRNELQRHDIAEPSDVKYQLLNIFKKSSAKYQSVIVDEAQDMSMATLRMIRAILPEQPNDLLLAGDAHQRIYGRQVILSRCGINIRGRGRRLRINYRTPERIRNWAIGVLQGIPYDDLDGQHDTIQGYTSLIQGEAPPAVHHFKTKSEEQQAIIDYIHRLVSNEPPHHICLVAPYQEVISRYEGALTASGIAVHILKKNNDTPSIPGVRLATMHRVKGLEYDHIIVGSANHDLLPNINSLRQAEDDWEKQEIYRKSRSLLYVACTRARKSLYISSFDKQSDLIKDIIL